MPKAIFAGSERSHFSLSFSLSPALLLANKVAIGSAYQMKARKFRRNDAILCVFHNYFELLIW
jgi:hypothetical protein